MSSLHSDAILERLMSLHPKVIDLTLGRIERLLDLLGHPEKKTAAGHSYRRHQWQRLDPGDAAGGFGISR